MRSRNSSLSLFLMLALILALVMPNLALAQADGPGEVVADGLNGPMGVLVDPDGNVWVIDSGLGGDQPVEVVNPETESMSEATMGNTARIVKVSAEDGAMTTEALVASALVAPEPVVPEPEAPEPQIAEPEIAEPEGSETEVAVTEEPVAAPEQAPAAEVPPQVALWRAIAAKFPEAPSNAEMVVMIEELLTGLYGEAAPDAAQVEAKGDEVSQGGWRRLA